MSIDIDNKSGLCFCAAYAFHTHANHAYLVCYRATVISPNAHCCMSSCSFYSTLLYFTLLYSTLAAVQTRSRMLVRQPVHTRLGVPCHVCVKTACSLNLLQGHQSRRRACSTDCKQARLHLAAKLNFASMSVYNKHCCDDCCMLQQGSSWHVHDKPAVHRA